MVTYDWLRVIGYVCEYLYMGSHTLSDCKFKDFVHFGSFAHLFIVIFAETRYSGLQTFRAAARQQTSARTAPSVEPPAALDL